jgi:SAM-dependent methyltransferase
MPFYDAWLDGPFGYRIVQNIFAPGFKNFLKEPFRWAFCESKGWVLDVGCGPRPITPERGVFLVGVDLNQNYLKKYTGGELDKDVSRVGRPPEPRRRMGFQTTAEKLPFRDQVFDEVRTTNFFHHLDDSVARRTLLEMRRCLKPGGRWVIIDAVLPLNGWARPLAWLTLRLDRGRHMRTEESFRRMLSTNLTEKWVFRRVAYTYTGLECLLATSRKARSLPTAGRPR